MMVHFMSMRSAPPMLGHTARRLRTASYVATFLHQSSTMSTTKKDRWTEAEVLALPSGEHDYFDRKSGLLLTNKDYRDEISKAAPLRSQIQAAATCCWA